MRRVDLEVDGLSVDALVASCYPGSLILDLALDVRKIVKPSVRNVVELGPFGASRGGRRLVRIARWVGGILVLGDVDELEDQGSTGADAASSGKKVSADDVFKDGRFAGRLGADDNLQRRVSVGLKRGK